MLKKKAYVEISEEIENIKKAREKFEQEMKEVKDIKTALVKFSSGMTNIVKILENNEEEMKFHKKIILELAESIQKLEEKGKPDDDVMFK